MQNPADLPSRRRPVKTLKKLRWWEGQTWLKNSTEDWPKSELFPDMEVINSEKKKTIITAAATQRDEKYYLRFYSYVELKQVQMDAFNNEEDKRLSPLQIVKDSDGLLRLKTKVFLRDDHKDFRLPIILPSNHPGVKALIIYKHVQLGHVGVQMLMYNLRESYWILKGRKTIKEVIKTCILCKRFNAKPISVSERLLPQDQAINLCSDDVKDLEHLTPAMFLSIERDKKYKRGKYTLSEGDFVLVGDDHTKRLNWNLGKILKLYPGKDEKVRVAQVKTKFGSLLRTVQILYLLEVMEKNKSSVHPINSPLFSVANEGSHLPINIDPELSEPQRASTSSMQPCSSISNGGVGLKTRGEICGHHQAETSSMQPYSSVSYRQPELSRDFRPLNCQMT
ncbi:uncharacterized protein TNCV_2707441 [Trichonephila clavipes]|nr:uncharacterized protein TNCV_2707441 [Trichonephila clavipes]